jgi:NAD-dependent deacetylase
MIELSDATQMGIRCAADIIRASKHGVALTGAGISTPSGIPDFRSTGTGLWQRYDPFEVASLASFRYDPAKFYGFMRKIALQIQHARPNQAHIGLAKLEQSGFIQTIITQNIDGLQQQAGSQNVIEVHGTMGSLTCVGCYKKYAAGNFLEAYLKDGQIPHCPECGGVLKPDLILFGEQLPAKTWLLAQKASKACDMMIVAGSSLEVLPVAGLPMRALENGAHLILINRTKTYIDVRADVVFHDDVDVIIPRIVATVLEDGV